MVYFVIEGYRSGKCVMVMSAMEDILEAFELKKELIKRFEGITFAIWKQY